MTTPKEQITKALGDALSDKIPGIISEVFNEKADRVENEIAAATLNLLAGLVEAHGANAIDQMTQEVVDLIKGDDPMAALKFKDQPDKIEALVSALQSAEAKKKEQAEEWAVAAGAALKGLGTILAGAVASAIGD